MNKILFPTIIFLIISCQPHNQDLRMGENIKNQKEIDFIKNKCQKYQQATLPSCIKKAKSSFRCLNSIEQYLEKINLQGKIECRKEANIQFPYSSQYKEEEKNDFELKEEDLDIIQDNIDYFLATDKIYIYRYNKDKKNNNKPEVLENNYKNRFDTFYSRSQFIKKCQNNFDDREDIFKQKYVEKCHNILDLPKSI
tara:strand:+ start:6716 stop:7303 length:588 start_codon:yes stop_codon:yes gene_type:complete